MIRFFRTFAPAVLAALLPPGLHAAEPPPPAAPAALIVGVESDARPFSFVDRDGQPAGFAVDLTRAVAADQNLALRFVIKPWPEIWDDFLAGKCDLLPNIAYTPERNRVVAFTVHHVVMDSALFARTGDRRFRTIGDLAGQRVAVLRNSFAHDVARNRGWTDQLVPIPTLEEGFTGLARGDYDGLFAMRLIGLRLIRDLRLGNVDATDVRVPGFTYELHMGVHPGHLPLLARLNQGLVNLRATGTYEQLYERWIGPYEPRALRWRELWPYVVTGALLLAVVLAALGWQRRLLHRLSHQAGALRRSEERLTLVIAGGGHGLWDWDLRTGRIERNERVTAMLGYNRDEIAPNLEGWLHLVHADDLPRLTAVIADARQTSQQEFALEYRVRAKDGEWRWLLTRGKVMERTDDGQPARAAGTHTDITGPKRAEEEQEHLQRKMLDAQKLESLGVLAGGVAHDFNNLLTVILGSAALVRLDPALGPDNARRLERVLTAGNHAADLCRQLLAYAGRGNFAVDQFDLNDFVRDTTRLLDVSLSRRTTLELRLAERLPVIEGDPSQIRQVIMNLVMNASEALGENEGAIRVTTSACRLTGADLAGARPPTTAPDGDYVCLEVADTGCGMTPEVMARIFDPFFTTKFTGRGLGLAAVIGIVRSHAGVLKVESTPGSGSTFRAFLPVAKPADASSPLPAGVRPAHSLARPSVLVAEDEVAARTAIADALSAVGFKVAAVAGGREALDLIRQQPARFAVVLLNVALPDADADALLNEVRVLRPDLPTVALCACSETEAHARWGGLGLAAFVRKPAPVQALVGLVFRLVLNR